MLLTVSTRMDSSQNCPRSLGLQPSCPYDKCRQCSTFCVMLNGVGIRGTIGIVGQQLLNQLPTINGSAVRSERYGQASYMELDRSMINYGYGES